MYWDQCWISVEAGEGAGFDCCMTELDALAASSGEVSGAGEGDRRAAGVDAPDDTAGE